MPEKESKIISDNPKTIEEAVEFIESVKNHIGIMANNDKEFDHLKEIIENLRAKKISPQEAAQQANGVMWGKQDK